MFAEWKRVWVSALQITAALAIGCVDVHAAEGSARKGADELSGKLLLTGSSTMAPLMIDVGQRFRALYPRVQIEVQAGGSGRGISDVGQGKADIGMASRALTDQESGLFSFAIGRDGICLVIHRDNPVRSLSNSQVSDLYTGKITNWSKVGGRDAPIRVLNPKEGYASVDLFTHFFKVKYADIKAHSVVGDNPERIRAVIENPDSIAYTSVGSAQRQAEAGAPIKLLPVEGVAATQRNIRNGNYPISRPLLLVTKEVPAGLVKEFIQFSLSSQITDIVSRHDFVPYVD
jgi:phosphate transport system substrate-binding protein